MAYGACANDMRSSRDALAKSRFPGVGKGLKGVFSYNIFIYTIAPRPNAGLLCLTRSTLAPPKARKYV